VDFVNFVNLGVIDLFPCTQIAFCGSQAATAGVRGGAQKILGYKMEEKNFLSINSNFNSSLET